MQAQLTRQKNIFLRKLIIELICYAYILLFLYASFYKLLDIALFQRELAKSPLIGGSKVLLSWMVPLSELAIAVMLLVPKLRFRAMVLASLLMAAFTCYITYLLGFAPWVPCSCGGILATMDWKDHLVFNSVFIVLGCLNIVLLRPTKT